MHHIRLDDHGFTELCKSIRLGEPIVLDGHDLVGHASQIVVSAEIMAKLELRNTSGRLPVPAAMEKTA